MFIPCLGQASKFVAHWFFHTGSYIFTRYLYLKFPPVVSQWTCFAIVSTVIVPLWGSMRAWYYDPLCSRIVSGGSIENNLGGFLNVVTWLTILVLDMLLYFCGLVISTMAPVFGIFPLLVSHGAVIMVYPLWLYQFSFLTFPCLWVQLMKFYLVGFIIVFFDGFTYCSFSGYNLSIVTLLGSAWVNGRFNWYEF